MLRAIHAQYDDAGIWVYQAFRPEIVQAALAKGTFDAGFGLERMTWIKPSFGWMLYRSAYATKPRQEAILKIKLSHEGFLEILGQSVETVFDRNCFPDVHTWKQALDASDIRHQWDPDRALEGYKLDRRAIQLGLKDQAVHHYVNKWIIGLEEVTQLAKDIHHHVKQQKTLPHVPEEKVYPVNPSLAIRLGMA